MDKETLSNYGWVVICVLVLVVMISLATPFGKYVATAVQNTTTALTDTADKQAEKADDILDIVNPTFEFDGEKATTEPASPSPIVNPNEPPVVNPMPSPAPVQPMPSPAPVQTPEFLTFENYYVHEIDDGQYDVGYLFSEDGTLTVYTFNTDCSIDTSQEISGIYEILGDDIIDKETGLLAFRAISQSELEVYDSTGAFAYKAVIPV